MVIIYSSRTTQQPIRFHMCDCMYLAISTWHLQQKEKRNATVTNNTPGIRALCILRIFVYSKFVWRLYSLLFQQLELNRTKLYHYYYQNKKNAFLFPFFFFSRLFPGRCAYESCTTGYKDSIAIFITPPTYFRDISQIFLLRFYPSSILCSICLCNGREFGIFACSTCVCYSNRKNLALFRLLYAFVCLIFSFPASPLFRVSPHSFDGYLSFPI